MINIICSMEVKQRSKLIALRNEPPVIFQKLNRKQSAATNKSRVVSFHLSLSSFHVQVSALPCLASELLTSLSFQLDVTAAFLRMKPETRYEETKFKLCFVFLACRLCAVDCGFIMGSLRRKNTQKKTSFNGGWVLADDPRHKWCSDDNKCWIASQCLVCKHAMSPMLTG